MRMEGTFTPTGGVAQPVVTDFEAEIENERILAAPLVLDDPSRGLTIDLRLDLWFKNCDAPCATSRSTTLPCPAR